MISQTSAWIIGIQDAPSIWKALAGFGIGVAGLSVLLLVHDTLRHRFVGAPEWGDEDELPDSVSFGYSRLFLPCIVSASAGLSLFCTGVGLDAFLSGGGTVGIWFGPIVALPSSTVFLLLLYVLLRRIHRHPQRALVTGTMTLDAEGIVLDGWHRTKIPWSDVASVRRLTLGTSGVPGIPHDYLVLKPHNPVVYRSAAHWDSLMQHLGRPIFGMLSRPCCVFAATEAFLDRALREQPAPPAHPSPSQ